MAPDLNSLPPSRSPSGTPLQPRPTGSPSPRSSSLSLAASATINAGIQNEEFHRSSSSSSRNRPSVNFGRSERRRSNVPLNLNLNDPSLPGPGELQAGDPRSHSFGGSPAMAHHQRAPSLGELHQELEQEQEFQVNRLLELIRQQQAQLQQIQQMTGHNSTVSTAAVDDSTPTSERSFSFPTAPSNLPTSITNQSPRSPALLTPFDLARQDPPRVTRQASRRSRTPSRTGSPALRPLSVGLQPNSDEWVLANGASQGSRSESAFYQAETQMLTRENLMLRMRIGDLERELERQVNDGNSATASSPVTPSNLRTEATPDTAGTQVTEAEHKD
ncbi:hypothetical protein MMC07_007164 [Pseudocyphellaria aurata]|nr:hypothetical protein [Pseudocyphellaria aurata]